MTSREGKGRRELALIFLLGIIIHSTQGRATGYQLRLRDVDAGHSLWTSVTVWSSQQYSHLQSLLACLGSVAPPRDFEVLRQGTSSRCEPAPAEAEMNDMLPASA